MARVLVLSGFLLGLVLLRQLSLSESVADGCIVGIDGCGVGSRLFDLANSVSLSQQEVTIYSVVLRL
jgi:hypothetical protein